MQNSLPVRGALLALVALLLEPQIATAFEIRESASHPPGIAGKTSGAMAKAGTALRRVFGEFQAHAQRGGPDEFAPSVVGLRYANGRVLIDAIAAADGEQLQEDLRGLGLRRSSRHGSVVSGMMPLAAVRRMVGLGSLRSVRVSWKPMTNAGTVMSEGVAAMRADWSPASAYDGTGITVGVLSDSYDYAGDAAAGQAAGDLPGTVTVLEDGACSPSVGGCIDEGRAMMELVHDVAPGADGAFHSAFLGLADFANGIEELAAFGADVIVDDVLYFAEPMFQDGLVAKAVDTVVDQGVAYFSSAGNSGRQSYESAFVQALDGNGDPEHLYVLVAVYDPALCPTPPFICNVEQDRGILHDFDPGPGIDYRQSVTIPAGDILTLVLQWDQPWGSLSAGTGSKSDMDVYLVDPDLTILVDSIDDNLITGDAIEVMQAQNTGTEAVTVDLLITNFTGPEAGVFKYVLLGGLDIDVEYPTFSSTTYGHANAAGAEAVGAAFYQETPAFGVNPAQPEWFTSWGGTPILFGSNGQRLSTSELRQKPEIVAPDGTNTTFFYSDTELDADELPNFFGTSAAAPHAAGVAALMLEANASLSPGDIYAAMEDTAEDMGAPGVDFESGFGLVRADLAIAAVGGVGDGGGGSGATPVVTAPADVTEEATASMNAVQIGTATATDAEDGGVPTSSDAPDMFPVGMTMVTWSATDSDGNTANATQEITVTDTTPPTVTPPADVSVEATDPSTDVALGSATAADLVDGAPPATADDTGPYPVGTTVVTWNATDTAGNTGSGTQNVTVTDTTAPAVSAPTDVNTEATGPLSTVALGTATATDAADPAPAVTNDAPAQFALGTTTVVWTATDASSNAADDSQSVTVVDTTGPTVTAPADVNTEATGTLTDVALGGATATDLVDGTRPTAADNTGPFPVGTSVVTWSASDTTGNGGDATQSVMVVDTTGPTVTAPPDINTEATGTLTDVALGSATATDLVDGAPPATADDTGPFPAGKTVVTWSATDAAGNTGSATQNVTVTDTSAPVMTAPADINTEATGPLSTVALGTATATDAVDPAPAVGNDAPAQFGLGTTTVVWTATDASDNAANDSQSVTVVDTTAPVVTAPTDVNTEATGPLTTVALGTATATDAVDPAPAIGNDAPAQFGLGTATVVWTATDGSSNAADDSQSVTVVDTTGPAVTAPADVNVEATGALTTVAIGTATATDLVDGARPTVANNTGPFPLGTTGVIWSSTDTTGNFDEATQNVTVADTTAPAVTAPTDVNTEATGPLTTVAIGTATATDAVDPAPAISSDAPAQFALGATTVVWTATDGSSNAANDSQTVTLVDTVAPAVTAPGDVVNFEATGPLTPVALGTAVATDAVDPAPAIGNDAPAGFALGTTAVVWTATDGSGNAANDGQSVTVVDTTAPSLTAPADVVVPSTGAFTDVALGTPTAFDAVDATPAVSVDNPGPFPIGDTVVTWTATDDSSNISIANQTVTVTDSTINQPPVANGDAYATAKHATLGVAASGVLSNDTDPEGGPLTATVASNPSSGSLSLSADGSFTYTPNRGFSGPDSFTYLLTDNVGDTDTGTVTISVTGGGGGGGSKPCNPNKKNC